ncbi:MAG: DUF3775 domain-containing protein [Geminicoccaceae bacterium]|nr:MAG: DUF3775 domain-containing protein [Geminicoccaceae bacterium]
MLTIDLDKVRFVIEKARVFDADMEVGDEDEDLHAMGAHTTDEMLEDEDLEENEEDDPVYGELKEMINDLNEDEQVELVALAWVGRGTYGSDEWASALEEAQRAHNRRTAEYLLGMPLLADYLAEGLAAFGESVEA